MENGSVLEYLGQGLAGFSENKNELRGNMIVEQIEVTPMRVLCYLVADKEGGSGILIDPAGDFNKIEAKVKEHNVRIISIVNTHGHTDHTGGNKYFMDLYDADVRIHQLDFRLVSDGQYFAMLLQDDDALLFGSTGLRVIHTPGHTDGSICLYGNGFLFTGDTMFHDGTGATDTQEDCEKLMDAVKQKLLVLPDDTVVCPGHRTGRESSTIADQKKIHGAA